MLSRCAYRPPPGLARRSGEDDDIGRSERDVSRSARRAEPPSAEARVELLSFLRCRSTLSCENVCSWGCGDLGRRTACGVVPFRTGDEGVLRSRGAEPVDCGACRHRCCFRCCCCCAGALHSAISTSERRAGMPTLLSLCSAEAGCSMSTITRKQSAKTARDPRFDGRIGATVWSRARVGGPEARTLQSGDLQLCGSDTQRCGGISTEYAPPLVPRVRGFR